MQLYHIFFETLNIFVHIFMLIRNNGEKRQLTSSCLNVRPSVRPSVRMEKLGSHWTGFREI